LSNFLGGIVIRPYNLSQPRPTVSCQNSTDPFCFKIFADPPPTVGPRYIWFWNLILDQVTVESTSGGQGIFFEFVDWVSSVQTPCLQATDTYNVLIRNSKARCSGGISFTASPSLPRTCYLQINNANISSSVGYAA
jgi:hypothetical protein